MLPYAQMVMPDDWVFMNDNDPKHTAGLLRGNRKTRTRGWFADNNVPVLVWPSYSPDLNPIEHVWGYLARRMRGKKFRNEDELFTVLSDEWEEIPLDFIAKIVDSMPARCKAVIKANGYSTKY